MNGDFQTFSVFEDKLTVVNAFPGFILNTPKRYDLTRDESHIWCHLWGVQYELRMGLFAIRVLLG